MKLWEVLIACGLPSGFCGLIFWHVRRYIESERSKANEAEVSRQQTIMMIIDCLSSQIGLSNAIATTIQKGRSNGEMKAALKSAKETVDKLNHSLTEAGIKNIYGGD